MGEKFLFKKVEATIDKHTLQMNTETDRRNLPNFLCVTENEKEKEICAFVLSIVSGDELVSPPLLPPPPKHDDQQENSSLSKWPSLDYFDKDRRRGLSQRFFFPPTYQSPPPPSRRIRQKRGEPTLAEM